MPGPASASPTFDFRTGGSASLHSYGSSGLDKELTLNSLKGGGGSGGYKQRTNGTVEGASSASRLLEPPSLQSSSRDRDLRDRDLRDRDLRAQAATDRYTSSGRDPGYQDRYGGLGNNRTGGGAYPGAERYSGAGNQAGNHDDRGGYESRTGYGAESRLGGGGYGERSTSGLDRYSSSHTTTDRHPSPLERGESRLSDSSKLLRPSRQLKTDKTDQRRDRKHKDRQKDEETEDEDDSKRLKTSQNVKPAKKKKRRNPINVNIGGTRYDVIRQVCDTLSYTIAKDDDPYGYLIWNDAFVATERISELKPYQRINHFPGMGEICRKDLLARNMTKMSKLYPDEYNYVPKTWIFPNEYSAFQSYARELKKKKKSKTFIVKPSNGAMGNGIMLYRNAEKIPQNEHTIVQEYLDKPLLVDGYKVDLRIYVLVTSVDPLRVFLFHDGLLRMGTEKYVHPTDSNVDHLYMHLTNYSVNKHSDEYVKSNNTETGSKRSLSFLNEYLRRHDYDVAFLWRNITDMIVKTMIVAHPHILHAYRMCRPGQAVGADSVCFEVLGFDVMLDKKLRPWLLEINRSPSFGTDEKLDYDIKFGVVLDTLRLLNIKASDKRKNIAAQKAEAQRRLLRPNKRLDVELSELDKKRQSVERKKDELKDMLARMRKDSSREDFENRNCGRFKRIFPPEDKFRKEKYSGLLAEAFGIFLSGRATSLQKEIERTYNYKLREEDVLDMLAQCEADEKDGKAVVTNRPPRGPKVALASASQTSTISNTKPPLSSMPTLSKQSAEHEGAEDREDDGADKSWARPASRHSNKMGPLAGNEDDTVVMANKEREDELSKRTLMALNDMRIKFPGKSDEEAEYILDKLHENWKFHKPRIASYWLVKLDSIKRRKVIDIVRSNVRAVLQRTWKCADLDSLRMYRIFSRVFNRLLWSHGQGLWNCFQTTGNSWETIFSKSSETVSDLEMACCRRMVQLCRDCLLIVYQFAAEAKATQHPDIDHTGKRTPVLNGDSKSWTTPQTLSQRMSRLYSGRAAAGSS